MKFFIAAIFFGLLCSVLARADVVYESATLGPTGDLSSGVLLQGNQWAGARFTINAPVMVTGVGGHLTTLRGTLFASIVSISSASAVPGFSPADIETHSLASTIFTNGSPSNDYITPLSVLLPAGNYGLVFGGGEGTLLTNGLPFGVNGAGRMPVNNSLLPGASLFYASMAGTWEESHDPLGQWRFVVEGSFNVPEPFSILLLAVGSLILPLYFRRYRRGAS